jgi:hypothetical protein
MGLHLPTIHFEFSLNQDRIFKVCTAASCHATVDFKKLGEKNNQNMYGFR